MSNVFNVVNKVAIVVILIIAVALGLGTLLDRWLDTGRIFTLLFILGSVPLTLTAIYRISLSVVSQAQPQAGTAANQSEDNTTA